MLGPTLKKARLDKGYTLEDVASQSGYSKALISRIENNNVSPSIESLTKIAGVLGLALHDIFASIPLEDPIILRKGDRTRFKVKGGDFDMEFLVPNPHTVSMLAMLYTGDPGAHSTHGMGAHPGQEWAIIIKGKVEVTVGQRNLLLKEGDSIYFNSNIPHKYINVGRGPAEGVAVTIPPSY
ncbi:MAG: cupin domain-containing protein [Candidatus Abyssubacteria bacterium]